MKKRELYKLELMLDAMPDYKYVTVIRTDNNYGLQGYVYEDGKISLRHHPMTIPNYIVKECLELLR